MMMYPFSLWYSGGRVGVGAVGGPFLGVLGWCIGQIHLHVVRHFFQKVRGNQSAVAVEFPLMTVVGRAEDSRRHSYIREWRF